MSTPVVTIPIQLTVRGGVSARTKSHVLRKTEHVLAAAPLGPVLHAHVVIDIARDPANPRPARVEIATDVNGTPVRVHVAAGDVHSAADIAADRLQQRLAHLRERTVTRHRWIGVAGSHSWRHGDVRPPAPGHPLLPVEERTVVRRTTLAPEPMSPDEAAYDMDLLDHDFLLFTDAETGSDAVVYRRADGGFGLCGEVGRHEQELTVTPLEVDGPLPVLTETQALDHLDVAGETFVWYRDADDGRGRVVYRRYDGHYGLVAAA